MTNANLKRLTLSGARFNDAKWSDGKICQAPSIGGCKAQPSKQVASMRDKIINRDAGGQSSMDTALIGSSSLPVWKMLSVASTIPGGDRITEDYAQLVAVDVAYAYFTNLAKTLRNAMQNEAGKSGPDAVQASERILTRLGEIEQEARDMLRAEYQKGMQVAELSRSLQLLHQSINAGMPTNIFQSMLDGTK